MSEYVTWEIKVHCVIENDESEKAVHGILSRFNTQMVAALHGCQPLVSLVGPTERVPLPVDE